MPGWKISEWLVRKLSSGPEYREINKEVWDYNNSWESWATSDEDHWWDKPEAERLLAVIDLWDSDPAAAFNSYKELADEGSIHAMIWLGHCYDRGHGTEASFEKAYNSYQRAIDAGSWIATLDMAALLFKHERFDECEALLTEGIECHFIPAFYWLAWYRIQRSKTRATYDAVKPLLTRAACEGHPQARGFLAVSMMLGKFGWREIPRGIKKTREDLCEFSKWREENSKAGQGEPKPANQA
jgi:TPR repeat protein